MLVTTHITEGIGIITLNRPEKRNALNPTVVKELKQAFEVMKKENAVKVISLESTGTSFCAGADLAYIQALQKNTYEENLSDSNNLADLFLQIYEFPKPIVAVVQGPALAGGCGLASVCDYIIASEEATFGYTEPKIGFIPAIVSTFLIDKLGEHLARELLIFGQIYTANNAFLKGLCHQVVPSSSLSETKSAFLLDLLKANSGEAMSETKKLIQKIRNKPLHESVSIASQQNALARESKDCIEGIKSFLEKKKPNWN